MPGLLTVGVPYVTEAFSRAHRRAGDGHVRLRARPRRARRARRRRAADRRDELARGAGRRRALPLAATLVMRRSLPPETPGAAVGAACRAARCAGCCATARSWPPPHRRAAVLLLHGRLLATSTSASSARRSRSRRRSSGWCSCCGSWAPPGRSRAGWPTATAGGRSRSAACCCARGGLTLSLVPVLGVVIVGLSLVTLGNFSAVTAAQLGVAGATDRDRGVASAMYFSAYYVAGALGAYVPGLAWEQWHWTGVWAMALAAYAIGGGGAHRGGLRWPVRALLRLRHLRTARLLREHRLPALRLRARLRAGAARARHPERRRRALREPRAGRLQLARRRAGRAVRELPAHPHAPGRRRRRGDRALPRRRGGQALAALRARRARRCRCRAGASATAGWPSSCSRAIAGR